VGRGLSELRATNENRQGINPPHLNPLLTKRRRYFGPRGCLQMVVARKWIHRSTDQASFLDPGESGRNLPGGGGRGSRGTQKKRVRKKLGTDRRRFPFVFKHCFISALFQLFFFGLIIFFNWSSTIISSGNQLISSNWLHSKQTKMFHTPSITHFRES